MKVKIAELEEIQSLGDTLDTVLRWLEQYATDKNFKALRIDRLDVDKEADGWYVTMAVPKGIKGS